MPPVRTVAQNCRQRRAQCLGDRVSGCLGRAVTGYRRDGRQRNQRQHGDYCRGCVVFEDRNERVMWALRRLYYRQRDYRSTHGRYASDLSLLNVADIRVDGMEFRPSIQVTDSLYELRAAGFDDAVLHLRPSSASRRPQPSPAPPSAAPKRS